MIDPISIDALAREFSRVLRAWLTDEEMAIVIALNTAETSQDVCHSHDYCDANMAMFEAYKHVYKIEPDFDCEEWLTRFNAAWAMAKASHFSVEE